METCQSKKRHDNSQAATKGRRKSLLIRLYLPVAGFLATLWMLLRIIPKPSRASYPCMKVAAPLVSTFIAYIAGGLISVFSFNRTRVALQQKRYRISLFFTLLFLTGAGWVLLQPSQETYAYTEPCGAFEDPLGPNKPIGEAKGNLPGRVIWVHNPDATNENCVPDKLGDGYFLDSNCNQDVVDNMFGKALLALTDAGSETAAWDMVFKYFNQRRNKGEVGYQDGETIFIKINAVHAWNINGWDNSILNDENYGNVDTSPQAVMTILRQLVYQAGVSQSNIYIGDPYTHIFKHCYDKWHAEFPDVHYMDKSGSDGRETYTASNNYIMQFSDRGHVISEKKDKFYTVMEDADYLLDIPAMKGHRWGGVTLFGKNFFGANARPSAAHMHPALHREDYDKPLRGDYGMYRVFVDLLGHEELGGKILIYFMDALWACSYEHEPPVKFQMAPFNDDWCSSILLSQDPLAIESVCLDILQAEFPKTETEEEGKYWYANFPAVDDYLHQAADSSWWPEGIRYDPENDGTVIRSLGVHEHWNNPADMQYSRNLGTGAGIELIKIFGTGTGITSDAVVSAAKISLYANYPNPFNPVTSIRYHLPQAAHVTVDIFDAGGMHIATLVDQHQSQGVQEIRWDASGHPSGTYLYRLQVGNFRQVRKCLLVK